MFNKVGITIKKCFGKVKDGFNKTKDNVKGYFGSRNSGFYNSMNIKDKIQKKMAIYSSDIADCKEYARNIKTWYKLLPNILTILRPIGVVVSTILFSSGIVIPGLVLASVSLATDFFDGKLARRWNVQSELGADLDAVGDKITSLGLLIPILSLSPGLFINLGFEGLIALLNMHWSLVGLNTQSNMSGKIKTWFLSGTLLFGYLVKFFNLPLAILNIASILTSVSQGYTFYDYRKEYLNEYAKLEKDEERKNTDRTNAIAALKQLKSKLIEKGMNEVLIRIDSEQGLVLNINESNRDEGIKPISISIPSYPPLRKEDGKLIKYRVKKRSS